MQRYQSMLDKKEIQYLAPWVPPVELCLLHRGRHLTHWYSGTVHVFKFNVNIKWFKNVNTGQTISMVIDGNKLYKVLGVPCIELSKMMEDGMTIDKLIKTRRIKHVRLK